ncbi:XTP/dITP diphosphatase [Veillonella caviae]|uniref:XTP/dITP diphosphatase n=1 Tax=Veillonella caviae TaxID=248316 RepID=UPI0023F96869|nr:XTP/dITP diphosphatase [Veillonella caviae]MCI7693368.1 XTP/dITP diphosphatase [Veillonella caviae]MDD7291194.1 XTP/dITP diphosphatase [Veillonella caviae]MDY5253915.1 XTP/dITP diphosphatase [Veillonella caviae]MDY5787343.1 XTP/dITP diphosphatase [Veillonella caviae]
MERIVLATGNAGKIREFEQAFSHMNISCVPVKEICQVPEPEETGTTFMENALLKARYYSEQTGLPCLADDSGLVVDALNGAPGVYSARYAGEHGDDVANNNKLIAQLQGKHNRSAHYVCALALAYPDGTSVTAEAACDGEIQDTPIGTNGFGYDPYFYVPQFGKTMAELDLDTKETISHRGKALQELVKQVSR